MGLERPATARSAISAFNGCRAPSPRNSSPPTRARSNVRRTIGRTRPGRTALHFFAGSPQGLIADLIHQGATGASGNTYEPFLGACVRPDYLFPAYYQGRNLAESYYIAMPALSWQGVVVGDPLCTLGKP